MNDTDRHKIEASIKLLQQILGKSSSVSAAGMVVPGFDEEIQNFKSLGEKLEPQIKDLTLILIDGIELMKQIMSYSSICRKFSAQNMKKLQEKYMVIGQRIGPIEGSKNFHYHAKAIKQIFSALFWVFVDSPQYVFKGAIQSADFNALKFQKQKISAHNDWYASIAKSFRTIQQFVKKNYKMGLMFHSKDEGNWEDLIKGGSAPVSTQKHHQAEKQSHKEVQPVQKKAPKKQLQGLNWLIANFNNQKITFNPGQVQMKYGIFIENCTDCVIIIEDKFKSLQMNKAKGVTLVVNNCVSGVEAMNCQDIKLYIKGQTPSLAVDKSQKVRIVLNQKYMNVDIVSSKVSEFHISYQSNGNESKDYSVSQQLVTKWNSNTRKFETSVYDKFL